MSDRLFAKSETAAQVVMRPGIGDQLKAIGLFHAQCLDADGRVRWEDEFRNTVVYVGMNLMLDSALAGSAYTVTGPYMGLISSVGYSAITVNDTMASHAGWTEAGNTNAPTFAARQLCVWNPASAGVKSLSAPLSFTMTGGGTLEGAFITYGPGAVATIDSTTGTLFSAGLFTTGARVVLAGDVVNVSYQISL